MQLWRSFKENRGFDQNKLSDLNNRKVREVAARIEAKMTVPKSPENVAEPQNSNKAVSPKSWTPVMNSKVIALKNEKQAIERPEKTRIVY